MILRDFIYPKLTRLSHLLSFASLFWVHRGRHSDDILEWTYSIQSIDMCWHIWNIFETGLLLSVRLVRLVFCPDVLSLRQSRVSRDHQDGSSYRSTLTSLTSLTGHLSKIANIAQMVKMELVSIFCTYIFASVFVNRRGVRVEPGWTPVHLGPRLSGASWQTPLCPRQVW